MTTGRLLRTTSGRTQPSHANAKATGDYPNAGGTLDDGRVPYRQYVVGTGPTARLSGQATTGDAAAGTRPVLGSRPSAGLGTEGAKGRVQQPGPPPATPARSYRHTPKVIGKGRQQGGGG